MMGSLWYTGQTEDSLAAGDPSSLPHPHFHTSSSTTCVVCLGALTWMKSSEFVWVCNVVYRELRKCKLAHNPCTKLTATLARMPGVQVGGTPQMTKIKFSTS